MAPTYHPTQKKSLDDVRPKKKRVLRKLICCDGDPPCGWADCSACTTAFLDRLMLQIEAEVAGDDDDDDGEWLPFTLIPPALQFSEAGLKVITLARIEKGLRDFFRADGLNGLPIIAAFDISREDWIAPYPAKTLFSIHLHGWIKTMGRKTEILKRFKKAYPGSLQVKTPFAFHKLGSAEGWAKYKMKDPTQLAKRVHHPEHRQPRKCQMN